MSSPKRKMNTGRISRPQKLRLIELMKANREVGLGQFDGPNARRRHAKVWQAVAIALNGIGGPEKSSEQWKRAWIDWKAGIKKVCKGRLSAGENAGHASSSSNLKPLSDLDKQVIPFFAKDSMDGDGETVEYGFERIITPTTIITKKETNHNSSSYSNYSNNSNNIDDNNDDSHQEGDTECILGGPDAGVTMEGESFILSVIRKKRSHAQTPKSATADANTSCSEQHKSLIASLSKMEGCLNKTTAVIESQQAAIRDLTRALQSHTKMLKIILSRSSED